MANVETVSSQAPARSAPRSGAPQPPYGAYASIMVAFGGLLAGAGVLGRALDAEPRERSFLDLTALGLATFKLSRTIARDEVTSVVRAPFVEQEAHAGGERPVQTGDLHQAIGELVTCSRCVGTWVAAGLGTAQLVMPRFGRILTWTLAAGGANDFAQAGFAALTAKANALERAN